MIGFFSSFSVFFLAAWPRFFNRYFGVDTWRILTITDYIQKKRDFPKYLSNQYLIQGKFDHPVTLSFFLAFFPKRILVKYQWVISPLIEAIHSFVLFYFVFFLTKELRIALYAQMFYALTPMVLIESSQLSIRSIGSLFFTLTWLSLFRFYLEGGWGNFALATVLVIILTFTHRMSIQVLLLLSFLHLLITFNFWYLFITILGMTISWFVFGDKYKRILIGHLKLMRLWFFNIEKRYAHQIRGIGKKQNNQNDFIRRIEKIFIMIPGVSLLAPNIWIVFLLFCPLLQSFSDLFQGIYLDIYLWAILLFVLGIATSVIKPLRFLGSGDRYIEYTAFPVSVIMAFIMSIILSNTSIGSNHDFIFFIIILVALFGALLPAIIIQIKVVLKDKSRSLTPELFHVIDFLNQLENKEEIRLACIPHQLADGILYFTNKTKVYLTDSNHAIHEFFENWWPVIKQPLSQTLKDRQIGYLLINENYVKLSDLNINYKEIIKEGSYYLIQVK